MSTSGKESMARYEIIQNELMEKIQDGTYKPNDRIPSETEIKELYNVSRITASKALTELSLNGYIYRVRGKGSFVTPPEKWIHKGNFPDQKPQVGPRRVGVVIPEFYDYHSGNIITGILDTLKYPEYFVDLVLSCQDGIEENALNYFLDQGFCGVILFPTDCEVYSDTILQMHLNKFPLVLLDRSFPGIACSSVTCNNETGTSLAVEHLISLGHTQIAFLADSTYKEQVTSKRYNRYLRMMAEHGLPVYSYENFSKRVPAYPEEKERFLSDVKEGRITAVIASNSHVALRLFDICNNHGIKVPADLSIICFDNPNFYRHGADDFFTYIDQGSLEMGKHAASILHDALTGSAAEECQSVVLTPELVVNHSTAAPKK